MWDIWDEIEQHEIDRIRHARSNGFEAGRSAVAKCPYESGTIEYDIWLESWLEGNERG